MNKSKSSGGKADKKVFRHAETEKKKKKDKNRDSTIEMMKRKPGEKSKVDRLKKNR